MSLQKIIEATVSETIVKVLDDQLPSLVERVAFELCENKPDQDLTEVGFRWASYFALRKHWPDVDRVEAANSIAEYIGVKVGTSGYSWTYSAAQEVAKEYADQFGEAA